MRSRFQHGPAWRRLFAVCAMLGMTSSLAACHKAQNFDAQFTNVTEDIEERQNAINHDMANGNASAPMPADAP